MDIAVRSLRSIDPTQTTVGLKVSFTSMHVDVYTAITNLLIAYFGDGLYFEMTDPGHSTTLKSLFAVWTMQANVAFPVTELASFLQLCITGEVPSGCSIDSVVSVYIGALRRELEYLKPRIEVTFPGCTQPTIFEFKTMGDVLKTIGLEQVLSMFSLTRRGVPPLVSFEGGELVRQWIQQNVPQSNVPQHIRSQEPRSGGMEYLSSIFDAGVLSIIYEYLMKDQTQRPVVVHSQLSTDPITVRAQIPMHTITAVIVQLPGGKVFLAFPVRGSLNTVLVDSRNIRFGRVPVPKTTLDGEYVVKGGQFGDDPDLVDIAFTYNELKPPQVFPGQRRRLVYICFKPFRPISLKSILKLFKNNPVTRVCVVVVTNPSKILPEDAEWKQVSWGKTLSHKDLRHKVDSLPASTTKNQFSVTATSSTFQLRLGPGSVTCVEYAIVVQYSRKRRLPL